MRRTIPAWAMILALGLANPVLSQETPIGRTVESLLDYERKGNASKSGIIGLSGLATISPLWMK